LNKKYQEFDKERLFNYVKSFSFPRLSGTEGEKKAIDLSIKTFKDIGVDDEKIEVENFEFSDFYSTTLIKLLMALNLTFNLMLLLFIYIYFFVTIILIVGMAIIVFLIIRGLRYPEKDKFWAEYFGNTLSSSNVIVMIPAKSKSFENAGDIVISAHLDSKSQTFKTAWRIVIYRIWLYSGVILGGFYFALIVIFIGKIPIRIVVFKFGNLELTFNDLSIWTLISLISISNVLLMFLNTHNKSPGALDNATGMAVVFELTSYFKDHPLENFNLWFCQFGAEELGTMGSREFVNNREEKFKKGKTYQLNFDIISSATHKRRNRIEYLKSYGILPRKKIAPLLGKYLDQIAQEENINLKGFHLSTGAHLDSVPFHLRGYNAVDISTRAGAKWTHKKDDTPDKVDPQILLEACIIAQKTILKIDKDFQILYKH